MTSLEKVINNILAKTGNGEDLTMEELEIEMTLELTEDDEDESE
jgi:hypothetical protein